MSAAADGARRAELDDAIARAAEFDRALTEGELVDPGDPQFAPRSAREHVTYHPHRAVIPPRHQRNQSAAVVAALATIWRKAWPWLAVIATLAAFVAFGRTVGGI